ncbi:hypothetical protein QBC40DRAFT_269359 [Triangularia verruculosa]|uniref:Uncharacterized protein n=1 Tax=Triangularia verruculosa TaxID=2587418 RepID=A0AAN7ARV7_9PEZI|nr:hypothetical protein QBC40DRAFT_269359 [Triangularia verruculosa]
MSSLPSSSHVGDLDLKVEAQGRTDAKTPMPLQQNTFVLVPQPVTFQQALALDGPESKPPMTTKQAQKAYREANRLPKMTKAERRRQERAELERIRKEEEKEKASKRAKVLRDRKKAKEQALKEEKRRQGLPLVDVRPSQATISTFLKGKAVSRKQDADAFEADQPAMMEEAEDKENQTPVGSPSESRSIKRQRLGETSSQQHLLPGEETSADLGLHPASSPAELLEGFIDDFPTASQAARELEDDEPLVETTELSPARRGPPAIMKSSPSHGSLLEQEFASRRHQALAKAAKLRYSIYDDSTEYSRFSFSDQGFWSSDDELETEEPEVIEQIDDNSPCVPTLKLPSPSPEMVDKISPEPAGKPSAALDKTEDTLDGFTASQFFSSSFKVSDEEVDEPQPLTTNQPPCDDGTSVSPIPEAVAESHNADKEAEERRLEQEALERRQRLQNFLERAREEERLFELAEQEAAAAKLVASKHDGTQLEDSMAPLSQESDYGPDLTLDNAEEMDRMVVPMEAESEDSDEYGPGFTLDNVELLEALVRRNA